jgi:hypothetical protein
MKEKRKSEREEEISMTLPTFSLFIGPSVTFAIASCASPPPFVAFRKVSFSGERTHMRY